MERTTIKRWSTGRWYLTYLALVAPAAAIDIVWLRLEGWMGFSYSITVIVLAVLTTYRLELIDLMRQADARVEELKRESEASNE